MRLPWFHALSEQEALRLDALEDSAAAMEAAFDGVKPEHRSPDLVALINTVSRIVAELTA